MVRSNYPGIKDEISSSYKIIISCCVIIGVYDSQ